MKPLLYISGSTYYNKEIRKRAVCETPGGRTQNLKKQRKNQRETGAFYERMAGCFLEQRGYRILEYNYRCPFSEIDIVAQQNGVLVFCEVKYRAGKGAGSALEAVNPKKQRRISKAALFYISQRRPSLTEYRFDVIGIEDGKVRVIPDAFPFCG